MCVRVYQDEDLQTRTGREKEREREKGSSSERRMYCVLVSAEEQKKTPSLARRK